MLYIKYNKISLSMFMWISLLIISLFPVIIYTLLSKNFFTRGLDSIHQMQLQKTILISAGKSTDSHKDITEVFNNFENIPDKIKQFLPEKLSENKIYRIVIKNNCGDEEGIYFILYNKVDGKKYYAIQKNSVNDTNIYIRPQILFTIYYVSALAVFIIILLIFFIKFITNMLKKPIQELNTWSSNLNISNINNKLPDFTYPELNNIAKVIQKSVLMQLNSLHNEQIFWRYCSHELRTSISIIQIGLDLLEKISKYDPHNLSQQMKTIQRIKRSSYSMSQLIETLLWMGKNENLPLSQNAVNLSKIIEDVISNVKKIFPDNYVYLKTKLHEVYALIPETALRIILVNTIKNAFQHSHGGRIKIIQRNDSILISNTILANSSLGNHTGFGLGLEITRRLTKKLGWYFYMKETSKFNLVKIKLPGTCFPTAQRRPTAKSDSQG